MQLIENIGLQNINWQTENGTLTKCTIARLDEIHPIISGNKLFKLKYNLDEASNLQKGILTMGGAYSNHLAATAYACKQQGLPSIGLVRGEITGPLNTTLGFCVDNEMKLISIKRQDYYSTSNVVQEIIQLYPNFYFVPEGGSNSQGQKGCSEILSYIDEANSFSHIVCAVGTGTTFRGIASAAFKHQTVIAIPVLKIPDEQQKQFVQNHLQVETDALLKIFFKFSGKGYAQKEEELFSFMKHFYTQTKVPLDFVYTAKLMRAVSSLFDELYFLDTDKVLVLHTGGLQGNKSLAENVLNY